MRLRNLILSITAGAAVTIGLVVALSFHAAVAQAQPIPDPAAPTIDHSEAVSRAFAYLQARQLPNGGIEGWTPGVADDFTTLKAVIALAAARRPVDFLTSVSGTTPLDYLETRAFSYTRDMSGTLFPGRTGMLIAAVVAGDGDPHAFGTYPAGHGSAGLPVNPVQELQDTYDPATGAYSTTASQGWTTGAAIAPNQVWAILGLAAAQETVPAAAAGFLVGLQEPDGGWGWGAGFGDVDTTALVLQGLVATPGVGPTDAKVQEGLAFLRDVQAASGGWEAWGSLSADTTAAAIQAIVAAGYTPATASWATASGRTPHDDLAGLQMGDGSFGGNTLGTAHAIAGLAEAPLPLFGRVQRASRALTWMNERQNADGSWSAFGLPDPGATCDAVLAYAAAGFDPGTVKAAGGTASALDYLSAAASSYVTKSADSAGKLAVAAVAAGRDPRDLGGVDVVHVLTQTWYSPTLGAFGVPTNTYHQAWAMLGLKAAGEAIPASATQTLLDLQQPDGGWKYDLTPSPWNTTTADNTGLALQALIAAGVPVTDAGLVNAIAFLGARQDARGGWDNANSTAYAMQGLLAAGEDLVADWSSGDGHSPYDALAAYQKPDGPFVWVWDSPWGPPNDDLFATRQAVPALLGAHTPFSGVDLRPFAGVDRGPDPDRMVAVPPRATWSSSVDVIIPFGSDLDGDGSVALDWRVRGAASWVTGTPVYRAAGAFTAALPVTAPLPYEFQVTFADPDGVQRGSDTSGTALLPPFTLEPYYVYMPLVLKSS